ncbi:MAG: DUF192 domain-containing protein [Candidatus Nanohaloarchaea archaeon]
MEVVDTENGNSVEEVERRDTLWGKFKGLRMERGRVLMSFRGGSRPVLDMFLVPEPLELAFIDSSMEIVEVKQARPWTWNPSTWSFYRPEEGCSHVLEVERGLLEEKGFRTGHELEFRD